VFACTNPIRRSAGNPVSGMSAGNSAANTFIGSPQFLAHPLECRHHPAVHGVTNPALNVLDAFVPSSIEGFGRISKLDDPIARQVFGLDFAALFPSQAD
jgi:hypothetical protein